VPGIGGSLDDHLVAGTQTVVGPFGEAVHTHPLGAQHHLLVEVETTDQYILFVDVEGNEALG